MSKKKKSNSDSDLIMEFITCNDVFYSNYRRGRYNFYRFVFHDQESIEEIKKDHLASIDDHSRHNQEQQVEQLLKMKYSNSA